MVQEIGTEEARRLHEEDAQFVEVLGKAEYDEEHLPGAVHIPLRRLDERAHEQLDAGRPVVVYCFDHQWDQSPRAACRLQTLGFREVYDYVPGKAAWMGMALPFEGDKGPETRAGAVARRDTPSCGLDEVGDVGEFCVVIEDGIVLGVIEDGEMKPGPSTFRPSVPREELAAYLDEHDQTRTLITTLDGRLVGAVYREDL